MTHMNNDPAGRARVKAATFRAYRDALTALGRQSPAAARQITEYVELLQQETAAAWKEAHRLSALLTRTLRKEPTLIEQVPAVIDSGSIVPEAIVARLGLSPAHDWAALHVVVDGERWTMFTTDGNYVRALTELRSASGMKIPLFKFELQVRGWPDDWADALLSGDTPASDPDPGPARS